MIPVLSPIRFYDPSLTYDNPVNFQNPDNRVSTGYLMDGVSCLFSATPIPRQWPDGQPGIDILVNESNMTAKLYDADDEFYIDLIAEVWGTGVTRLTLNGNDGSGVADGYYTIKLYDYEDELQLESEAFIMAEWFDGLIPFEFWNFENDFGMSWIRSLYGIDLWYSCRMLVPVRMFDPSPEFEKEVYKNDPGVLTTLRTTIQRVFNFESDPVPVYTAELFAMAFANSELYLDRIKINSEEAPEIELIQGTNQKILTGKATLVNFHDSYEREDVDTAFSEALMEWASGTYYTTTITGDSVQVIDRPLSADSYVQSDSYTHTEGEVVLIHIHLTDDNSSDLPQFQITAVNDNSRDLVWGDNWISVRFGTAGSSVVRLKNATGEGALFTAVITWYKYY